MQVRDHPDAVRPRVRREHLARSLYHGPDFPSRGDPADERAVRLVDVETALLEIRLDLLRAAVQLTAGDAERPRVALQLGESVVVVGVERLFEPVDAVLLTCLNDVDRGLEIPTVELAIGGDAPAPVSVHHYVDSIADCLPHSGERTYVFSPVGAVKTELHRFESGRDSLVADLDARL